MLGEDLKIERKDSLAIHFSVRHAQARLRKTSVPSIVYQALFIVIVVHGALLFI